jgi:hypothetical protein
MQLTYHSHALRDNAGQLGALALTQLLQAIENESQQGDCICDEQRLSIIDEKLHRMQQELAYFVAQLQ